MANLENKSQITESKELIVGPLPQGRFLVKRGEYLTTQLEDKKNLDHIAWKERLSVDLPKFILVPTANGQYRVIGIMHPEGEFCAEVITPAERDIATEWGLQF